MACDPEGIHRAVLNIASNALDAVEDRPNPKVGLQVLLEADGNWAKIIVIDNGPGIPAAELEDIFKPFVSSKGSRGTGLGLPVSRKILREHGGDIVVQSVLEKGSKFTLRIPLNSAFAGEASGTHQHPPLRAAAGVVGSSVSEGLPSVHVNLFSKIVRNRWWEPISPPVGGMLLTISPTPQNCVRLSPSG